MADSTIEVLRAQFRRLAVETHVPDVDIGLCEKYFGENQNTPEARRQLAAIVGRLEAHRDQTVKVLTLCAEREATMLSVHAAIYAYKERKSTTLDMQTRVLEGLYRHQQLGLGIVEGVLVWREDLTRPYPFIYRGQNCLLAILADCVAIEEAGVSSVLPLRLAAHPLCSNMEALRLFGSKPAPQAHASKSPRRAPHKAPAADAQLSRLEIAEALVLAEAPLQQTVMSGLQAMAASGYFVTLLNIPSIFPNCATGIPLASAEWGDHFRAVVATAADRADADAVVANASISPDRSRR